MAKDFLVLSRRYRERTNVEVLKRRAFVAGFLKDNYKLSKNRGPKAVVKAAKEAGLRTATEPTIGLDAALYRTAFRYLNGDEKERAALQGQIEKKLNNTTALRDLLADGITSWADVERLLAAEEAKAVKPEPAKTAPAKESTVAETDLAGRASVALGRVTDALQAFTGIVQEALADRERLAAENRRLLEDNLLIRGRMKEMDLRLKERAVRDMEELSDLVRDPALMNAVQAAKAKLKVETAGVPESLPKVARSEGGKPIEYRRPFLEFFHQLPKGERRQTAKALHMLAEHGHGYPALESKKLHHTLPGTPTGSWWSRASREIRFTWDRDRRTGNITILDLVKKGDTRLGYSEA